MCLFPFKNKSSNKALLKGIEYFECGGCPECLQKKSRMWALRCSMQARVTPGIMVTLTYDTYKNGKDGEENPVDPSIELNKKHCQDFIKRLRYHFSDKKVLYLLSAERGKRTGRAHYHALLFNVDFSDRVYCKKSKRGNIIYRSKTLEEIWSHGICTIDCVNLSAKVARYCTKYCAKDSGVDDTFMLFSRGIGEEELLRQFNGKSYWIDGREYSIPRQIWQRYIESKSRYNIVGYSNYVGKPHMYDSGKTLCNKLDKIDKAREKIQRRIQLFEKYLYKHNTYLPKNGFRSSSRESWFFERKLYLKNRINEFYEQLENIDKNRLLAWDIAVKKMNDTKRYERSKARREYYQACRDNSTLYKRYLAYWKEKNRLCEITRPNEFTRILQLPESKYRSYRSKALIAKIRQSKNLDFVPPRARTQGFIRFPVREEYQEHSFAPLSRHYRANDRDIFYKMSVFGFEPLFLTDIDSGEISNFSISPKKIQKIEKKC